jgi:hypothetical protein
MFQYAVGRGLAERFDTSYALDLDFFNTTVDGHRANDRTGDTIFFQLENFEITAGEIEDEDLDQAVRFGRYGVRLGKLLTNPNVSRFAGPLRSRYALAGTLLGYYRERTEDEWQFNSALLGAGPNCYLEGYWECPKYFENVRDTLEREFRLDGPLSAESERIARHIAETTSVGLHVRRGDKVDHGNGLPLEYFRRAIRAFEGEDVTFFVFSVDMDWVRSNLDIDSPAIYVDHHHPKNDGRRTPAAYEYFELLNRCEHTIISNSTFSWWGAWLRQTSDSDIYCPYVWHPADPETEMKYISAMDLIPSSWNVVEWD